MLTGSPIRAPVAEWLDLFDPTGSIDPTSEPLAPGGPPVQPARRLAGLRASRTVDGAARGTGSLGRSGWATRAWRPWSRAGSPSGRLSWNRPPLRRSLLTRVPIGHWRSSGPTGTPGATSWRSTIASRATRPCSRSLPRGGPGSGRPGRSGRRQARSLAGPSDPLVFDRLRRLSANGRTRPAGRG